MLTICQTFQLARKAKGSDQVERYYSHPYLHELFGSFGLSLCLLGHLIQQGRARKKKVNETENEIPVNIFIMLPAALFNTAGEIFKNTGLYYMRGDAGTYQALTSSLMIWSGLLSIPVFRRNLSWLKIAEFSW